MSLAWTPEALPGIFLVALNLTLAFFIFTARPHRTQNRYLAAFLVLVALILGTRSALLPLLTSSVDQHAAWAARNAFLPLWTAALLLFLSTIQTPLVGPLRHPWVRGWLPVLALIGTVAIVLIRPDPGPLPGQGAPSERGLRSLLPGLIWIYSLVVAVSAYRRARGTALERETKWYMVAFVCQDALLFLWTVSSFLPATQGSLLYWTVRFLPDVANLLLVLLLSYGILSAQLFDIDLKLKFTVRQGTVAAIFVAVFFVVSESAATFLGARTGSTYLGIFAAALLVFVIAPLQRLADRVSDAALPHVQDTEAYRVVRKREVYRAAVESALLDGEITERERDVLAALQEQLDLRPTEARGIERELSRPTR